MWVWSVCVCVCMGDGEDNNRPPLVVGLVSCLLLSDMVERISAGKAVRRRSYKGSEYNLNNIYSGLYKFCMT